MRNGDVTEFIRRPRRDVVAPPSGDPALLDPRSEDPTGFLELDLGGVTPDGSVLTATYDFLPRDGLSKLELARADYTITLLDLNREMLRIARENAFGGFRARLYEYAEKREAGVSPIILERLRSDLLRTPHLTVFAEMRRQRLSLPEIDALLLRAPESAQWPLVPNH